METHLIDRIYECAFAPESWPGVLEELAKIADARGAFVFSSNKEVLNWSASPNLVEGMGRWLAGDYFKRSSRASRAINARHAGFIREYDIYTDAELQADPLYRDLLWPDGLGWAAAAVIPAPTGDTIFISVERERLRGPVENAAVQQLDLLRPHLARSALMSVRLHLERARAASEALAIIGLPALIFDERGRVLAANHLIEALTDQVRWRPFDAMSLKDTVADGLFRQAIETLHINGTAPTRSFAVRGRGDVAVMVAHVIPVRGLVRDIFVRSAGVLVLTPVTLPQAPPVELVQSLFDLTSAEARIARGLVQGDTISEIATTGGVSRNTVRSQMRSVLEKTGCRRQSEVVGLLGGLATLAGM